jgi:hypothetical protein
MPEGEVDEIDSFTRSSGDLEKSFVKFARSWASARIGKRLTPAILIAMFGAKAAHPPAYDDFVACRTGEILMTALGGKRSFG